MTNKRYVNEMLGKILLAVVFVFIAIYVSYTKYSEAKSRDIDIKSRYTFAVTIDSRGNVVENKGDHANHTMSEDFADLEITEIANIWTNQFLAQYTQKYLSWTKRLRNVSVEQPEILDENRDVLLIKFDADLNVANSDNYEEWNGYLEDGRLHCEWVVTFIIDNHYDSTATIYVSSIITPEEYGIEQNSKALVAGNEILDEKDKNAYAYYQIKNNFLSVTYDGGARFINVPVDVSKLIFSESSTASNQTLLKGSYIVSTSITAFLYGGVSSPISSSDKTPVTLVYSRDMGQNWITCEVAEVFGTEYYYLEFFDDDNAVIVVEYTGVTGVPNSKVFFSFDKGENWIESGSGPSTGLIKGVKFINNSTAFFVYKHNENAESNLFMTTDGAKTFERLKMESQKLENTVVDVTGGNAEWEDVFFDATVPALDKDDNIVIYLTQGDKRLINNGKTAAKYVSADKGLNFKFSGLVELE